ncbi:MAG: prepilin peptidase [Clostridia bacterium]|nr:prepilin peptidase [Clostridia bacterium]
MTVYFQSIIAIILCIISSVTDIKSKKIYNKVILTILTISTIINIVFWYEIKETFTSMILNSIISLIVSFIFFYYKIWAAGDAKLFFAISYIIPLKLYEVDSRNYFPSVYILILIFSITYISIMIESICCAIKDKNNKKESKIKLNICKLHTNISKFILEYCHTFFVILLLNNIINRYFPNFAFFNQPLIVIINLILGIQMNTLKDKDKRLVLFLILNIIFYIINGVGFFNVNFIFILSVVLITMTKNFSEKYNYEEIKVEDIKEGMILSLESSMLLQTSRIKNLPGISTEDTKSRLNFENVESIKRWKKSKKGKDTLIIVKFLPFAPFMSAGVIFFIIFKIFM